jgi:hypothetical protein
MPGLDGRAAEKHAISGSRRDKWLWASNFKPVGATRTAFFDLTTPAEAASCRACSSNRKGSLDS